MRAGCARAYLPWRLRGNQAARVHASYGTERAAVELLLQGHETRVETEDVPGHHVDAVGDAGVADLRRLLDREGHGLLHQGVHASLEERERHRQPVGFVRHDAHDVKVHLTGERLSRDVRRCSVEVLADVAQAPLVCSQTAISSTPGRLDQARACSTPQEPSPTTAAFNGQRVALTTTAMALLRFPRASRSGRSSQRPLR